MDSCQLCSHSSRYQLAINLRQWLFKDGDPLTHAGTAARCLMCSAQKPVRLLVPPEADDEDI
jgi:hypothetical protein